MAGEIQGRKRTPACCVADADSQREQRAIVSSHGCPRNRSLEEWETEVKSCASEIPSGGPSAITLRPSRFCLSIWPQKTFRRRCQLAVTKTVERHSSGSTETSPFRRIRRGL